LLFVSLELLSAALLFDWSSVSSSAELLFALVELGGVRSPSVLLVLIDTGTQIAFTGLQAWGTGQSSSL